MFYLRLIALSLFTMFFSRLVSAQEINRQVLNLEENTKCYRVFTSCDSLIESRENFMKNEILYHNDTLLIIHHWLAQSDFMRTIHSYKVVILRNECEIQAFQFNNLDKETFKVLPYHLKVKGNHLEVYSGRQTWVETIPVNQSLAAKLRSYYPVQ